MGWDIFKVKKKGGEGKDQHLFTINKIETFAPKRYLQEREMYYYNYRQIKKYLKPLLDLLMHISESAERKENEEIFIQGLFRKLKGFYDINNTLSIRGAVEDNSLKIKLLQLLKYSMMRPLWQEQRLRAI